MITPTTHMANKATAGYNIRNVILRLSSRCRSLAFAIRRTPLVGGGDAESDVVGGVGRADVRIDEVRRVDGGIRRIRFRRWTVWKQL